MSQLTLGFAALKQTVTITGADIEDTVRKGIQEEIQKYRQEEVSLAVKVLNIFCQDRHEFSNRPCQTCNTISTLLGKKWGCAATRK